MVPSQDILDESQKRRSRTFIDDFEPKLDSRENDKSDQVKLEWRLNSQKQKSNSLENKKNFETKKESNLSRSDSAASRLSTQGSIKVANKPSIAKIQPESYTKVKLTTILFLTNHNVDKLPRRMKLIVDIVRLCSAYLKRSHTDLKSNEK